MQVRRFITIVTLALCLGCSGDAANDDAATGDGTAETTASTNGSATDSVVEVEFERIEGIPAEPMPSADAPIEERYAWTLSEQHRGEINALIQQINDLSREIASAEKPSKIDVRRKERLERQLKTLKAKPVSELPAANLPFLFKTGSVGFLPERKARVVAIDGDMVLGHLTFQTMGRALNISVTRERGADLWLRGVDADGIEPGEMLEVTKLVDVVGTHPYKNPSGVDIEVGLADVVDYDPTPAEDAEGDAAEATSDEAPEEAPAEESPTTDPAEPEVAEDKPAEDAAAEDKPAEDAAPEEAATEEPAEDSPAPDAPADDAADSPEGESPEADSPQDENPKDDSGDE